MYHIQTNDFLLEVSGSLKNKQTSGHCNDWLEAMRDTSALIGAILSVIHPELYAGGMATLSALGEREEEMKEYDMFMHLMQSWSSVFSGMSVVSCRESPVH